jgi:hypothetical protein
VSRAPADFEQFGDAIEDPQKLESDSDGKPETYGELRPDGRAFSEQFHTSKIQDVSPKRIALSV